jgi:hypothetical protein
MPISFDEPTCRSRRVAEFLLPLGHATTRNDGAPQGNTYRSEADRVYVRVRI